MAKYNNDSTVTANDVFAYQGNAAAGLAGTGINANAPDNTVITQTARDLALQSFQANQILFNQAIQDRNAAYKLLDDDQLIPNDIYEGDRSLVDEKIKKAQDVFYNAKGNLLGDPKAYREFVQATQDAKAHIKQSQKRALFQNAELNRLKDVNDPITQEEYRKNMRTQLSKGFWAMPDPYAPITDYQLPVVAAPPVYGAPKQTTDGLYNITTTSVDPAATFDAYAKSYGQKANTHQFQRYVSQFLQNPTNIDRVNQRLQEKFGDRVPVIDPLTDRLDQIAAKIALADNEATKTTKEYDKDRAQIGLGYAKIAADNAQERNKLAMEWYKAKHPKGEPTAAELAQAPDFGNIIDGINTKEPVSSNGQQLMDSDGTPLHLVNGTLVRQDGQAPTQISINGTGLNYGKPVPLNGPVDIDVPVGDVNDVILSEFEKYNQLKEGSNNNGSKIDKTGGALKVRIENGQVAGIKTDKGAYADRNQFADITQKSALRGVTKQKPATNLGEYVPTYSKADLLNAGWTEADINKRVGDRRLKLK